MSQKLSESATVPEDLRGSRLDQAAAEMFPEYSRSQLQQWIKVGQLTVDRAKVQPKLKVIGGELLQLEAQLEDNEQWQPEPIPLDIVFEDDHLLIINKPAGLVVHPAAGNRTGTLLNALLAHNESHAHLPRAGIVHRLDKDTSGLMVVGKTLPAVNSLVAQLQNKSVARVYRAVVMGEMTGGGKVDAPIGRHPTARVKMAVVNSGKPAISHYRVLRRFAQHTYVQVSLETGRTHQIRVHMAHLHHPLVGDATYAGRARLPAGASSGLVKTLQDFPRQALHALELGLKHPETREPMLFRSQLPDDFTELLAALEAG